MHFVKKRRRPSVRRSRSFVPTDLGESGAQLEHRRLAAWAAWYRLPTTNFLITTAITDISAVGPQVWDDDQGDPTSLCLVIYVANDNVASQWAQEASVEANVIDSGQVGVSNTSVVEVTASHHAQGIVLPYNGSGPPNGNIPAVLLSRATEAFGWNLAIPGPGGAPTGTPLPPTSRVEVVFSASFTGANPNALATPTLDLRTNAINVFINTNGSQGLEIFDNSTAIPTLIYSDPNFGSVTTSTATVVQNFSLANLGGGVGGTYTSTMTSFPIGLQVPGQPDTSYNEDAFVWSITFAAYPI